MKLYWNCQNHQTSQEGCEDCEQISREMDPEYCIMGMGKRESPHDYQPDGWGIIRCAQCSRRKPMQTGEESAAK